MSSFYFYIIFLVTIYILCLNQLQNNFPVNPSVDRKSNNRVHTIVFGLRISIDHLKPVRKIKNKNKIK